MTFECEQGIVSDIWKEFMAFNRGVEIRLMNKSIEYNPYRHKGTAQEFEDFIKGYNA